MKRPLTILLITLLTILVIYACGSTIRTANTSFVTITFGEDAHTARLKAEKATVLARARYLLADLKLMPEAYAYIPSVVQVLVVTVSAADMTTPIVGIAGISTNQTTAILRIEVPNGTARQFTVEGIRGVDSQTYYRGTATTDLSGVDVDLPISMALVGPGLYVNFATGTDLPATSGTSTNPFQTITYALTRTTGTDAIFVEAGTYPPAGAAAGETYPLQLHPSTALICTGAGFSTVLDLQTLSTTAIYGNDRASMDNCMIRVNNPGGGGIAINDAIGGLPGQQSRFRINGSSVELSGFPTGLANIGVIFNDDSVLLETAVIGSAAGGSVTGVQVNSGKPSIIGNAISNLPLGVELASGAGDAVISGNTFDSDNIAVRTASAGKPQISANTFLQQFIWNGTGIAVLSGNPAITGNTILDHSWGITVADASPDITGNTISGNWIGIDISTAVGSPRVNGNTLYCNAAHDVGVNDPQATLVFDLRNNSWDHDTTTALYPGPTVFGGPFSSLQGDDIFVTTPTPTPQYIPFNAAVPNGCLPPQGVGKPQI
ncbi:MAG: DUF1565 domain-containing protein [Nitrospirota bacterium]|mgnify:CR=1 FL=1